MNRVSNMLHVYISLIYDQKYNMHGAIGMRTAQTIMSANCLSHPEHIHRAVCVHFEPLEMKL